MKTFKEFINENIKDLLTSKSEEEMLDALKNLDTLEKVQKIRKYDLPEEYMPSDEEIEKELEFYIKYPTKINEFKYRNYDGFTALSKIVLDYNLPEKFFPEGYENKKIKTISNIKKHYEKLSETFILKHKIDKYEYHINLDADLNQADILIRVGNEEGETEHFIYILYPNQVGVALIYIDLEYTNHYKLYYESLNLFVLMEIDELLENEIFNIEQYEPSEEDEEKINENIKDLLQPKSKEELIEGIKNYIKTNYDKNWIFIPHTFHIYFDEYKNGYTETIATLNLEGAGVWVYNKNMIKKNTYTIPYEELNINIINNITRVLQYMTNIRSGEHYDNLSYIRLRNRLTLSNSIRVNENIKDLLKPKSNEELIKAIKNYITNNFDKDWIFLPHTKHIYFDESKNGYTEYIVTLNLEGVGVWVYNKNMIKKDTYTIPYEELNIDLINNITRVLQYITNIRSGEHYDNLFINENFKDLLKGKSDDEIEKQLKGLSDMDKVYHILKFDIDHKYLPIGENKIRKRLINHIGKIFQYRDAQEINLSYSNEIELKEEHNGDIEHSIIKITTNNITVLIRDNRKKYKETGRYTKRLYELNLNELYTVFAELYNYIDRSINESVKNLLQGKSEDEIEKQLEGLTDFEKIQYIYKYGLSEKYLPENKRKIITDRINKELDKYFDKSLNLFLYLGVLYDDRGMKNKNHVIRNISPDGLFVMPVNNPLRHTFKKLFKSDYIISFDKLPFKALFNLCNLITTGQEDNISESVKNLLTGKSEDEVLKSLMKLSPIAKIDNIKMYNIDTKYMPSDEEIQNYLDNLDVPNIEKIRLVIRYELPEKFFPKDYDLYKTGHIRDIKRFFKQIYDKYRSDFGHVVDPYKPPNVNNFYFDVNSDFGFDDTNTFLSYEHDMYSIHFLYYDGVTGSIMDDDDNEIGNHRLPYEKLNVFDLYDISDELKSFLNQK